MDFFQFILVNLDSQLIFLHCLQKITGCIFKTACYVCRRTFLWENVLLGGTFQIFLRLWVRKFRTIGFKTSTGLSYLHFNCLLEQMRENFKNFFLCSWYYRDFKIRKNWTFVRTSVGIVKTDFFLSGGLIWDERKF